MHFAFVDGSGEETNKDCQASKKRNKRGVEEEKEKGTLNLRKVLWRPGPACARSEEKQTNKPTTKNKNQGDLSPSRTPVVLGPGTSIHPNRQFFNSALGATGFLLGSCLPRVCRPGLGGRRGGGRNS